MNRNSRAHDEAPGRRSPRRPRRARQRRAATPAGRRRRRGRRDRPPRSRGGRDVASSGNTASIGMTAMSWNSSTANADLPAGGLQQALLGERLQHDRGRRHRRAIRPTASACCHGERRARSAMPDDHGRGARDLQPAEPEDRPAQLPQQRGSSSRPTRNSIITTPNSAKCMTSVALARRRGRAPTGRSRRRR